MLAKADSPRTSSTLSAATASSKCRNFRSYCTLSARTGGSITSPPPKLKWLTRSTTRLRPTWAGRFIIIGRTDCENPKAEAQKPKEVRNQNSVIKNGYSPPFSDFPVAGGQGELVLQGGRNDKVVRRVGRRKASAS